MNIHSQFEGIENMMKETPQVKKTALLKASLELFSEYGIRDTPVSQIAKRAKIGVGTIYRYFPGKDALINSLYKDIHDRMIPFIRKDYSKNKTVREKFLLYFGNFIRYLVKHPTELSLMGQYDNHPQTTISNREKNSSSAEMDYALIFKQAMEEKLLKDLPLDMLGDIIMGMVISLAKFYNKVGIASNINESSIDKGVEVIWDAIKK